MCPWPGLIAWRFEDHRTMQTECAGVAALQEVGERCWVVGLGLSGTE